MENEQEVPQGAATVAWNQMFRTKTAEKIGPKYPQLLHIRPWHCRIDALAEVVERALIFVAHIEATKTSEQHAPRSHAPAAHSRGHIRSLSQE